MPPFATEGARVARGDSLGVLSLIQASELSSLLLPEEIGALESAAADGVARS